MSPYPLGEEGQSTVFQLSISDYIGLLAVRSIASVAKLLIHGEL
jgi:hypothetical protein